MLLLDIAEKFPGIVTIIPFSHSLEARIGADWAWGFVGPDGHSLQGMLVQAKRLDDNDSEYQGLSYQGGQRGSGQSQSQIDRLIESGKQFGLPPIYAFYNHLSDTTRVPANSCGSLGMISQLMPESWGVTIASAFVVRDALPDKTFDHHRHHSRQLHCLLCSGGTGRQGRLGSAGAAAATLSKMFKGNVDDESPGPDVTLPFDPTREWPELFQYAEELYRTRTTSEEAKSVNLPEKFRGIAGVVIMRDTREEGVWPDASPRKR